MRSWRRKVPVRLVYDRAFRNEDVDCFKLGTSDVSFGNRNSNFLF